MIDAYYSNIQWTKKKSVLKKFKCSEHIHSGEICRETSCISIKMAWEMKS